MKKILAVLFAVMFLITALTGCDSAAKSWNQDVVLSVMDMNVATITLNRVAKKAVENWENYITSSYSIYSSPTEAVNAALDYYSSDLNAIKQNVNTRIKNRMDKCGELPSVSSGKKKELAAEYALASQVYAAYLKYYAAVTIPSGSYITFTADIEAKKESFDSLYDEFMAKYDD